MLRIKYNNEFLDLAADQDNELEANSPMFIVDNVLAEYSTPLTIVYSDKNARLIGPLFFSTSIKKKAKLPVEIYKNDSYRCNATLVIESAAIKRNTRNNNASGYLLTGISSFFSEIKDVLLQSMDLGQYSNVYKSAEPDDLSRGVGYWQDFQNSWFGQMDFVVAPIRNDNVYNDTDSPTTWMNPIGRFVTNAPDRGVGSGGDPFGGYYNNNYNNQNGNNGFTYSAYNVLQSPFIPVFPQLFLKVAFNNIFKSVDWSLDASLCNDFDKLVVFSNFKVDTYNFAQGINHGSKSSITFNYADLLPRNTKASSFILAICKRYGWVPLCNTETRTCKLFPLKYVDTGALKDWTAYAEPELDSDFSADDQLYSFKNNFTGNDALSSEPDITALNQTVVIETKFNLPAPADIYDNAAIFCIRENAWYGIILDTSTQIPTRVWAPVKDNIFSDEKESATNTVETDCTTLAMTWYNYTTSHFGLFPYCSQPFNQDGGIRTLFYHGLVAERNADGSAGQTTYPYLSATRLLPDGSAAMDWSNVFKAPALDGKDYGIESFWFDKWIQYMKYGEEKKQVFNLPLNELVNFQWTDRILINNIPHLVISFTEKLARRNYIQAKLKRLFIDPDALSAGSGNGDSTGAYLKLVVINPVFHATYASTLGTEPATWQNVYTGTLVLRCYSDNAASIPFTPATPFTANYQAYTRLGLLSYVPVNTLQTVTVNSSEQVLANDVVINGETGTVPHLPFDFTYLLAISAAYTIIT